MRLKFLLIFSFIGIAFVLMISCKSSTPTITSSTSPPIYSISELKYKLLAAYPDYFWCDPDFYPVAHQDAEQQHAIDQFDTIRVNLEEFSATLSHLNIPNKTDYTDNEKLQIYRDHKKLNGAIQMTPDASGYTFTIRTGENQGKTYQGTISTMGLIKVTSEKTSFNTCPICLAAGTLIDSPEGPIPVEELHKGMVVYTVDSTGMKTTGVISETVSVPVPSSFKIITIVMNDSRSVSASPGHPTSDGRAIGELKAGDALDGTKVVSVISAPYSGFTYDFLPGGRTGLYWANGILLKSTLAK